MIANQTSRGLRSAARWIGLLGSSIALLAACSGTIEQTDVDEQHLEQGNTGKELSKPAEATTPPAKAASNQTAAAPTTPVASTPKAPDPGPAADDEAPPAADEDPPLAAAADLKFEADIWPIFNTTCGPCHSAGSSGGQSIGNADKTKALADAKSFKDAILRDISAGSMPPGTCGKPPGGAAACMSEADFADVKAWYDAGAPK